MKRTLFLLIFALLALLLVGTAARPALAADPFEPNNTQAIATLIEPVAFIGDAAIDPAGDVDFYRVTGRAGAYLKAWMIGPAFGPELSLLDAGGAILAQATGPANEFVLFDYVQLPADGNYYLRVRSATHPNGSGAYTLLVRSENQISEVEPNDTPAQGEIFAFNAGLNGEIDVDAGDTVDYYRFNGVAGQAISLDTPQQWRPRELGEWFDMVRLYDPSMNPVSLGSVDYTVVTLPATGVYTLEVVDSGDEYLNDYFIKLNLEVGGEPNDNEAAATLITPGNPIYTEDYPYADFDWYRFQGYAGMIIPLPADRDWEDPAYVQLSDGMRTLGWDECDFDPDYEYCNEGPYTLTIGAKSLYASADVDGLGGVAAIKQQDIAARNVVTGQWQLVFDASDVGIIKDVVAFEVMPDGALLLSLGAAQSVPGLGQVRPQDIIRFVPTSLGDNTAGTFAWYLDGSDVGLTTTGEKIDAIAMEYNPYFALPRLLVSTAGSGSAPKPNGATLNFADEDVIRFNAMQYGANTQGGWFMQLDGSTVPGMAAEDVNAAHLFWRWDANDDGRLLLAFGGAFNVDGVSGDPKDVVSAAISQSGVINLLDLTIDNYANVKLDAIGIGRAWK